MWPAGAAPDAGTASILWLRPALPNRETPCSRLTRERLFQNPRGQGASWRGSRAHRVLGAGHAARVSFDVPGLPAARPFPRCRQTLGPGATLPRWCWSLSEGEVLDRELRLEDGREPPRSACASCRSCSSFAVSSKFRWPSSASSSFFTFPVQTGQTDVSTQRPGPALHAGPVSPSLLCTRRRQDDMRQDGEHKKAWRTGQDGRSGPEPRKRFHRTVVPLV